MTPITATSSARLSVDSTSESGSSNAAPYAIPGLPDSTPIASASVEGLMACLMSEMAKLGMASEKARKRSASEDAIHALDQQIQALHNEASHTRAEAWVSGSMTMASSAAAMGGAFTTGGTAPSTANRVWNSLDKACGGLAKPLSQATYGARALEDKADSTQFAADVKRAESRTDDARSGEKTYQGLLDRATQILQAVRQERAATEKSLLRG